MNHYIAQKVEIWILAFSIKLLCHLSCTGCAADMNDTSNQVAVTFLSNLTCNFNLMNDKTDKKKKEKRIEWSNMDMRHVLRTYRGFEIGSLDLGQLTTITPKASSRTS